MTGMLKKNSGLDIRFPVRNAPQNGEMVSSFSIGKHSALYVFARGVPGLINLLALSLYTRLLNADDYGRYILVITGVGLLNLSLFNWLKLGILRFLPVHKDHPTTLLSAVAAGFLIVVAVTGLGGVLVAMVWPNMQLREYLFWGLGLLWTQAWLNNNLEIASAQLNPVLYGNLSCFRSLLGLGLGGGLAWIGWGAEGLLLGLILANMLSSAWLWRRHWKGTQPYRPDRSVFRDILFYGLPLSATASLAFILSSSDRFMIDFLLGEEQVGLYAAGYDLAHHVLTVICMTIGLAATPLAINAMERGGCGAAQSQFIENGQMFLAVTIPAAVGLFIVAEGAINLFIGQEFREAAYQVFPLIVVGTFLQGVKFYYLDCAFFLHKNTGKLMVTVFPAAVLNIVLNFLWLPEFGYIGAAWSTVLSYGLAFLFTFFYTISTLKMPMPWIELMKVLIAAGAMGASLILLRRMLSLHFFFEIALGIAVYAAIGWTLGISLLRDIARTILLRGRGM